MLAGCLIATATRPYAGWFLAAASALVLVHASLRAASSRTLHALALASVVAGVAIVSTPAIVHATSKQELVSQLQNSQNANASDTSSLKLGQVDFSSRGAIVRNLPGRMFDLMFRPFPWQLGDANQQLGVIETLFVLAALVLLVRSIARRTKPPLAVAGPLVYPAFMLLVAYSLAVGNAGTGFRYRTHIVALIIAIMVVLRARALVPTRRPAFARSGSLVATGVES
jgi:hypothetical protein